MNTRPLDLHGTRPDAAGDAELPSVAGPAPTPDDAAAALRLLRDYLGRTGGDAGPDLNGEIARLARQPHLPLSRQYPGEFTVDTDYIDGLPDLQNGPESLISGARDQELDCV